MPKKKKHGSPVESLIHSLIHVVGVVLLYLIAIYLPIWWSVVLLIVEVLQIKLLGHCFLTIIAHNRGVMVGMNFWEYMSYLFGAKNPKKSGKKIDDFIKITLVGILLIRMLLVLLQPYFSSYF